MYVWVLFQSELSLEPLIGWLTDNPLIDWLTASVRQNLFYWVHGYELISVTGKAEVLKIQLQIQLTQLCP